MSATHKKTPTMEPISEVRRVTFAAQYVLNEAHGVYAPVDVVRVRFIPHASDYQPKERRQLWYNSKDIRTMKNAAYRAVDRRRAEIYQQKQQKEPQQQEEQQNEDKPIEQTTDNDINNEVVRYSGDIRGLERLLHNDSAKLRMEALRAVLNEQYRQRRLRHGIRYPGDNASVNNKECGGDHEERIRRLVMVKGESARNQEAARKLARKDAAEVDEYLGRPQSPLGDDDQEEEEEDHQHRYHPLTSRKGDERDDGETNVTIKSASVVRRDETKQQQPPTPPNLYAAEVLLSPLKTTKAKTSTSEYSCWFMAMGQSLLLHAMLRPFIELQNGDALVALDPSPVVPLS